MRKRHTALPCRTGRARNPSRRAGSPAPGRGRTGAPGKSLGSRKPAQSAARPFQCLQSCCRAWRGTHGGNLAGHCRGRGSRALRRPVHPTAAATRFPQPSSRPGRRRGGAPVQQEHADQHQPVGHAAEGHRPGFAPGAQDQQEDHRRRLGDQQQVYGAAAPVLHVVTRGDDQVERPRLAGEEDVRHVREAGEVIEDDGEAHLKIVEFLDNLKVI